MLKVYICPICGSYRFVTSYNYTCYKCGCNMSLADIEYKNYMMNRWLTKTGILLTKSEISYKY